MFRPIRRTAIILWDAYWRFTANDGWAIASHVALSALLALFPFLIFVTAVAGFLGTRDLAEGVVRLLLEAWPDSVVKPIESEVHNVLTGQRRDLLTIGAALMLWFSSSGIEAARVGLNRAYGTAEHRWWFQTRAQSMLFVILAALGLLALAFLIVLLPPAFETAVRLFPNAAGEIREVQDQVLTSRYGITAVVLLVGLVWAHMLLPAGRRRFLDVVPGIGLTLLLWIVAATLFGWYLASFANYATMYAGFASVMIALVFLYFIAVIFIMGGELNAAIVRWRLEKATPAAPTMLPIDQ